MTRRQRLEAVINGEITDELVADCKEELRKMDEYSQKIKERETPQQKENAEIGQKVLEVVKNEELQIEEIKERIGVDITRQRLTAICTNLIRDGKLQSKDVKVKNKGKRKAYYI